MLLKDKLIETRNKIDSPDAEMIFQHVLKIDKAKIYSDIKKEINKKDLSSIDFIVEERLKGKPLAYFCLLYTSPSPRDRSISRMPSSA